MFTDGKLLIAQGDAPVYLYPSMVNRHGLIAGATGTGKTVTLKSIAQSMSDAGIPTFLADVKGDVSGMMTAGEASDKLVARLEKLGIKDYDFHACPVRFFDIYGEQGTPVRTTITEMGPVLLARLLGLTDVQAGVLNIAFHVADDESLLLLDLKDLRSMIAYIGDHAADYTSTYGQIAKTSVGAIQRSLLQLEDAGGDSFFGEPALDISDWLACDSSGHGYVNILDCVKLVQSPLLYSTFLLWMLSELYEMLPEAGDIDKPKMVFFFDEAHLLFNDAPKALLEKVEQIVKLIRSKGVGVWFITQNPADIPDDVLAQLGNRVQHALRAYTPAEQKAIKVAAESFRENPKFKTEDAITELATGEALISFLDEDGKPQIVERAMVIAPACSMGSASESDKRDCIDKCELNAKYATPVDRESAYELLDAKAAAAAKFAEQQTATAEQEKQQAEAKKQEEKDQAAAEKEQQRQAAVEEKNREKQEKEQAREADQQRKQQDRQTREFERAAQSVLTGATKTAVNGVIRGILGALVGKK